METILEIKMMFLCLLWDLLSFGPMAYGNGLTKTLDKSEITRTQNQSRKKKLYFFKVKKKI